MKIPLNCPWCTSLFWGVLASTDRSEGAQEEGDDERNGAFVVHSFLAGE